MKQIKIYLQGKFCDVECAARSLRAVLDVEKEMTISGDEGQVIRKVLTVNAHTCRLNRIVVIISPSEEEPAPELFLSGTQRGEAAIELGEEAKLNLTKRPYVTEGLSMAILGNKGAGKSWALAVVAEECHKINLPFVFYDPNGDGCSLRELSSHVRVIGRTKHRETIRRADYSLESAVNNPQQYMKMVLEDAYSLVVDLSGPNQELKIIAFTNLVNAHFEMAEDLRESTMMLVDEAHRFAPQRRSNDCQKESLNALVNVMSDGRKRGILLSVATQRLTFLNKDVLFGMNLRLFGKVTWPSDFDYIKPYLPPGVRFKQSYNSSYRPLNDLQSGEFYVVSQGKWGLIKVKNRQTVDLGATPVIRPRQPKKTVTVKQLQLPMERSVQQC